MNRQQGVALLTVILIVSLITIATVGMRAHHQLDVRRTVNSLNHAQATAYLQGAEYLSKSVLKADKNQNVDTLDDDWATVLPPFPVEGGSIGGSLEDLNSRFNINNLVNDNKIKSDRDYQAFNTLLLNLELEPDIADAIVDWLDAGDTAQQNGNGAEEGFYLNIEKHPYRAPNNLIASTSELLKIKGVDYKTYLKLKPFITALPGRSYININTADKEVIRMIVRNLSLKEVESAIEKRGKKGYSDTTKFLNELVPNLTEEQRKNLIDMQVYSTYFLLSSNAIIGQLEIKMKSIMKRDKNNKGKVTILFRTLGGV